MEFFTQLPSVRRMLWTDIDAAYEGDPAATTYEEIILAYPALEAIAIYRMAHLLYGKVPLIPRIMTEWAHSRTGINIIPARRSARTFSSTTAQASSLARRRRNRVACETLPGRLVHCSLARGGTRVGWGKSGTRQSKMASVFTPEPPSWVATP